MNWRAVVVCVALCSSVFGDAIGRRIMDLNGSWEFRLDPGSVGERERWYSQEVSFGDRISVPGCWQAQAFGKRSGILRNGYSGPAWYRRTVQVPASWSGARVMLKVGGALRIAELFVNGERIGTHDGMSAPFSFDVAHSIKTGSPNVIAIKVTNPGRQPGDSPDKQSGHQPTGMLNYIGNWGGIYGPVALEATGQVWVDQVSVRSDISSSTVWIRVTIRNGGDDGFRGAVRATVGADMKSVPVEIAPGQSVDQDIDVRIANARLWSPDDPYLYTAAISVRSGDTEVDGVEQGFGMRQITTRGNILLLNGKPLYLRGYGDDNVEVLTGVPPASKQIYLDRLRLARSFGFNAVRFHSMTPVREYFEAADEVGLLVLSELPIAYTQYLLPNREFLRNELTSIILAHRNHPSWLSLAMGNEFNLTWLKDETARQEFLDTIREFYTLAKSLMPDRIVMSNDGFDMEPTDMVSTGRRVAQGHPTIRHEFGAYYCSLPDVSLIPAFTGVMEPAWLAQKQRWVEENGLTKEYPAYVKNSQRLVQSGRKYQIEAARHDPDVTGYEYWLITDYPGGTGEGDSWEEGWFDYFWHPKGVTPEEAREINGTVLPLIDAGPGQRTLWADQVKKITVSVSNYGDHDLTGDVGSWRITSGGRVIGQGRLTRASAPAGKISALGVVELPGIAGRDARKLELAVDVDGHRNSWEFWSYPRSDSANEIQSQVAAGGQWRGPGPSDLWIAPVLDGTVLNHLVNGGRLWLALNKESRLSYFPASGGALGTVVEQHPAFDGLPHPGYADLQFFSMMEHATPFELDPLPAILPIVGGVRTRAAFLSKAKDLSRVGYVFEAKVGSGRLLVTTLRIADLLNDDHPEAVYLFDRLLRYCRSDRFEPGQDIAPEALMTAVSQFGK